jgi:hypothetical protein
MAYAGQYYGTDVVASDMYDDGYFGASQATDTYYSDAGQGSWPPKMAKKKNTSGKREGEERGRRRGGESEREDDGEREGKAAVGRTACVGMLIEAKRDSQGIRIAALAPGGPAERSGKVCVCVAACMYEARCVCREVFVFVSTYTRVCGMLACIQWLATNGYLWA